MANYLSNHKQLKDVRFTIEGRKILNKTNEACMAKTK